MSKSRLLLIVPILMLGFLSPAVLAQDAEPKPQQIWEDFIHYSRIAQLELATTRGQQLLDLNLGPAELLALIEASPYADDFQKTLDRAAKMNVTARGAEELEDQAKALASVAAKVSETVEQSRLDLARDPARIKDNIARLDDTRRAYLLSVNRLKTAGQYAAPYLLQALQDRSAEGRKLQPFVRLAMVDIGRPIVEPLSAALPNLPDTAQQQVSDILGMIGYPTALPYLKMVIESEDAAQETKVVAAKAFREIATRGGFTGDLDAASLFYLLAEDYYGGRGSLLPDAEADTQLVWYAGKDGGLGFREVPTGIYRDVMAMRAAKTAVTLKPDMAAALALWNAANFRRENDLPEGVEDPTYAGMNAPSFYAKLAGPRHLHMVLSRALNDGDPALALDAIRAIGSVAGTESLVNEEGASQPLLNAMNYPDRRVRYEAAMALAASRPQKAFTGAGRVIPVLINATRQTGTNYAVVITNDEQQRNQITAALRDVGYQTLIASSVDGAATQIDDVPGIDLMVVTGSAPAIEGQVADARNSFAMQASPIVVLGRPGDLISLNRTYADVAAVTVASAAEAPADVLPDAIKTASASALGQPLDEDAATEYALQSLGVMREITLGAAGDVFQISDAEPGLVAALGDGRNPVASAAGRVLAQIDAASAQQSLAAAAIGAGNDELQISFLQSVATNARLYGAQVSDEQAAALVELAKSATGEVAVAAAEACGALNLATELATSSVTGK